MGLQHRVCKGRKVEHQSNNHSNRVAKRCKVLAVRTGWTKNGTPQIKTLTDNCRYTCTTRKTKCMIGRLVHSLCLLMVLIMCLVGPTVSVLAQTSSTVHSVSTDTESISSSHVPDGSYASSRQNTADVTQMKPHMSTIELAPALDESAVRALIAATKPATDIQFRRNVATLATTSFTSVGKHNFTVPSTVYMITMTLTGAVGGASFCYDYTVPSTRGGYGGIIVANIPVIPGETINIYVGGQGTNSAGGYNDGGNPCTGNHFYPGGGGGGATDVRRPPFMLADRILVAGGGGGSFCSGVGGSAGYPSGETSFSVGGSATEGGAAWGSGINGQLGLGGSCSGPSGTGAGGGAGYYGAGGSYERAAGGGSSYASTGYVSSSTSSAVDGAASFSWVASPSAAPTIAPSPLPSRQPSSQPSRQSSSMPTCQPSLQPASIPSVQPSSMPSAQPSVQPNTQPTSTPTTQPSEHPSNQPSTQPTAEPSSQPSIQPSSQPSTYPSSHPSSRPSMKPTAEPSGQPRSLPSAVPTTQPSLQPSLQPSETPTSEPTSQPSALPTTVPSTVPTSMPSVLPSVLPSTQPSVRPSWQASSGPSNQPSVLPTSVPTSQPTRQPSCAPSSRPSSQPTVVPSVAPTTQPSAQPNAAPSTFPSAYPSSPPAAQPSSPPSTQPSAAPSHVATAAPNVSIAAWEPLRDSIDLHVVTYTASGAVVYCAAFVHTSAAPVSTVDILIKGTQGLYVAFGERANITVTNLLPVTLYDVYCTTVTPQGVAMAQPAVVAARRSVRTLCCKSVRIQLAAVLQEGTVVQRGLRVAFDALPAANVKLQCVFHSSTGAAISTYPSSLVLSNVSSSAMLTQYFTLLPGAIGEHNLEVVLSGPSTAEYNVTYEGSAVVKVVASGEEPATPQVMSAMFSNDGSSIVVYFDAPTDKGGYYNAFPCAKLLNFTGSAAASCLWSGSSQVAIFPTYTTKDPTRVLTVGSSIALNSHHIRAACTGNNITSCASWSTVPSTEVQVSPPVAPTHPTVILSVPATLGSCSSLTVDLTGSIGAAGRPWSGTQFKVLTALGVTAAARELEHYLTANFTLNPPFSVPHTALQKGFTYSIQATLCNFLGTCASAVKSVTVLGSVSAVPVVSILGQSRRYSHRSSQLVLNSNAFTQACDGAVSSANLEYSWSVDRLLDNGTLTLTALRSSSQNPAVFKLPAYALTANTQYAVSLRVKSAASGVSAGATVTVSLLQGSVVAIVTSGSTKQLKLGEAVQLDASQSYDEDVFSLTGEAAGLTFLWTCVQIKPVFNATCAVTTVDGIHAEKLTVRATLAALNTTSVFTVTTYSSARSSSTQVEVVATGGVAPKLEIRSDLTSLKNIDTGKQLVLYGSLIVSAPCTALWSVDDQDVDFFEALRTPATKYMVPSTSGSTSFNLVLAENILPQRSTLVFSLTCGSTSTSLTVTTNGAPLPGEFTVSPPFGDELSTMFTFMAMQWADPDLPLTYQFGFQSATTLANLVVVSRSEIPYAYSKLPAGRVESLQAVTCALQVFDSLGAYVNTVESVTVQSISAEVQRESLLEILSSSTGSVDSIKNIIAVVSSVLNSVNCSAVQNCSELNRSPCLKTSGECGPCLNRYIGEAGDRSTLCIPAYELVMNNTAFLCSAEDDCPNDWQVCDPVQQICVAPPKSCSKNCSNHGTCIFLDTVTGGLSRTCTLEDTTCEAACSCVDQYSGDFCEIGIDTLQSRRQVRSNLIYSLRNLTELEDVNMESVGGWSASLYSLCIRSHELSVSDATAAASIVNITLRSAIDLKHDSFAELAGVLQTTDTVASLLKYNYYPNDFDDGNFGSTASSYVNNTAATVVHMVSTFGDLVARSMVLGQNSTTLLYDNFRLSVHIDVVSPASQSVDIESPQSPFEVLTNAAASSVELVPAASGSTRIAVKVIAVYPRSYSPDTSAFVSSPLLLQVQSQDLNDDDNAHAAPYQYLSNVEFTFQHNAPQYEYLHHDPVNFTTVCTERNESQRHSYMCPESGHMLTHNCSQGAGVHTSYCPKPAPGCAKLGVDSADITVFNGCTVVDYNLTFTTCSCPVLRVPLRNRRRHLSTSGEQLLDDSGAANLMVATVFIAEDFADTFHSAKDFNSPSDAQRVLAVIIMLGVLWGSAAVFLGADWLYSMRAEGKGSKFDVEAQRSVAAYIESTIPGVFNSERSSGSRLWSELLAHHDLFHFMGDHSTEQRRLVVAKTVTMLTFMLFLTAAFFDISNPGDDGTCVNHETQGSCLKRTCPFDSTRSYCQWSDDGGLDGAKCSFASQSMSLAALFYLTLLTTILSAIASIPLDYLFSVLTAPTAQSLQGSNVMYVIQAAVNGARRVSRRRPTTVQPTAEVGVAATVPVVGAQKDKIIVSREVPEELVQASAAARASIAVIKRNSVAIQRRASNIALSTETRPPAVRLEQLESQETMVNDVSKETTLKVRGVERSDAHGAARSTATHKASTGLPLCCEVIEQRLLLTTGTEETAIFEAQWGVVANAANETERDKYRLCEEALTAINADVLSARKEARKLCKVLPNYNEHHAGLEILHLFMVDLLGRNTPAAKIFQEKFGEDFGSSQIVVLAQKIGAALLLVLLNAFFMYYILLKAFQKGYEWQIQYLVCSVLQFVIDLMVFHTSECVWLNYALPQYVNEEVEAAARKLRAHVDFVAASAEPHPEIEGAQHSPRYIVNAPDHLFVSAHVARKFPELMESMIVSSYTDHLPGEICRTWPHYKALSEQTEDQKHVYQIAMFSPQTWVYLPSVLVGSIALVQQLFMTIPYLYQRVIIRFAQPMIFSGICVVWFLAVQSVLTAIVIGVLCGAYLLYTLRRHYLQRHATVFAKHRILPSADRNSEERPVHAEISPAPIHNGDQAAGTSQIAVCAASNIPAGDEVSIKSAASADKNAVLGDDEGYQHSVSLEEARAEIAHDEGNAVGLAVVDVQQVESVVECVDHVV